MTITKIKQWGNSLGVRIPQPLLEQLNLKANAEVEICLEEGHLILSPVEKPHYTLAELLEKMTPDSLHDETDWGRSTGKEEW